MADDDATPTTASQLKKWRRRARFSQRSAARFLGVPLGSYQSWEQGRREPHHLNLLRLRMKQVKKRDA